MMSANFHFNYTGNIVHTQPIESFKPETLVNGGTMSGGNFEFEGYCICNIKKENYRKEQS